MKKLILLTVMGVSAFSLAACGGEDKGDAKVDAPAKVEASVVGDSYTKADYMQACKTAMTETQCECYVDFYASIGLDITELGDTDKVTAAVTNLKPEQTMKMMECVQ
ncbi:MAG: hypothetical protein ACPGVT_11450 [Maricaulaceae bacterium]